MTETEALLVLNAIPGLGNMRIRKLLEYFGSASKIVSLQEKDLVNILPHLVIQQFVSFDKDQFLRKEMDIILKNHVEVITFQDESYPQLLKEIPDSPVILYVRGEIPHEPSLAMVGSRKATIYGMSVAGKFSQRLSELGLAIVSGMAKGIDTFAHQGTLKAKGKTMAVLGCGLTHIYPPDNKGLFFKIIEEGAVISEFPMTMPPLAINFPRRNRIISGLSLGVVVVEASLNSGALITAHCALEQGREVFAIPANIDHPNSRGVCQLIQQGAKLVSCVEDILEELTVPLKSSLSEIEKDISKVNLDSTKDNLSENEQSVYHCIPGEPIFIDELAARCHKTISDVLNIVLHLEIKHLVKQLPGKYFVRN